MKIQPLAALHLPLSFVCSYHTQCAPGFYNQNQKFDGIFHFNMQLHKTVLIQLKETGKENAINMQVLVKKIREFFLDCSFLNPLSDAFLD